MLLSWLVVGFESALAQIDHVVGGLLGGLREDFDHYDCVGIDPVDDPPIGFLVPDPQLVATSPNGRHGSGEWHAEQFTFLEFTQPATDFGSRGFRPWGRPRGRRQPGQWFTVHVAHERIIYGIQYHVKRVVELLLTDIGA